MILKVKLIHSEARLPTRMTSGSAGIDLYSVESMEIPPTRCDKNGYADIGRALVKTGIIIELPQGSVGRVGSRSGLSVKSNIEVGAGWIDSDYRGEIKVELKNLSSKPFKIIPGDRIAQLVIIPVLDVEVEKAMQLEETARNSGGFGSTDSKCET